MTVSRPAADVRALPAPRTAPAATADDGTGLVVVEGEEMTTAEPAARS